MTSPKALTPQEEITLLIKAREPVIWIVSSEEQRILAILEQLARQPAKIGKDSEIPRRLYVWDCTDGLQVRNSDTAEPVAEEGHAASSNPPKVKASSKNRLPYGPVSPLPSIEPADTKDPNVALQYLLQNDAPDAGIYVFNWLHDYMKDLGIKRQVAKLASILRTTMKTLIIVSPLLEIPPELQDYITVYHYPLPNDADLAQLTDTRVRSLMLRVGDTHLGPEQKERLVKAVKGLPLKVADRFLSRWMVHQLVYENGNIQNADTRRILDDKAERLVSTSSFLRMIKDTESLRSFGGYDNLKAKLADAALLFTPEARQFGLPYPKGFVFIGPPGVGKSHAAKVIAGAFGVMLLRMDIGAAYGRYLGQSESQFSEGLRTLEAVAPCVAWIDEYEKAFGRGGGEDGSGSPTEGRIMAHWLNWMQECQAPIFRVATINRIDRVSPEQVREGRWDRVFCFDLPTRSERAQILAVHLEKRQRDPSAFDLDGLAAECRSFTGAEIEQVVIRALIAAFKESARALQNDDLRMAIRETVPQARSRPEDIKMIRDWAEKAHALPASTAESDDGQLLGTGSDEVKFQI